jgi:hypothetical protein
MRALAIVTVLLFAQQKPQDTSKMPQEVVKDWKYLRKERNPKTGIEEVTAILDGKEAVPLTVTPGKEVFDIRGIHARYFTDPRSADEPSKEIDVRADRGKLDNGAGTLRLQDHVVVVKKGDHDQNEIDTILTTNSALLRFTKKYACPECRFAQNEPGRCPDHNLPLQEIRATSVEADREFELAGSEGILTGEGLFTDDAIKKEYHITKNGFVEFSAVPAQLGKDKPAPVIPEAKFTQIFSRGPLHVTGDENLRRIQGRGGMRIDRIDSVGTFTTEAREMIISLIRPVDPESGERGPAEIRGVDAEGDVRIEGVTFADGTSYQARSDLLARKQDRLEDQEIDLLTLTQTGEAPVSLKTGASTIDARIVTIDRIKGESRFKDVVRSDLAAGAQRFALSCGDLTTQSQEGAPPGRTPRTIKARNRVTLGGLLATSGGAPGQAEADAFDWDVEKTRGWLDATPFVRVTQGPSTLIAPRIVLESQNIIVLKGPKQVHFVQDKDEKKKEEYRATCESDLVLDQSSHRILMRDACVIQTEELLLHADRVDGNLSPDGKGLTSLRAQGHVCALRTLDHTTLYGDRLTYRFADQDLRVYGSPHAVADSGRTLAIQEEIRVFERVNPKTGKKVRYTEMIGSSDGVSIEIEERPVAPRPGETKK